MFQFFRIFNNEERCRISGYWCDKIIRLNQKLTTPFLRKVSVVRVCVDITFMIQKQSIHIISVKLSKLGTKTMGTNCSSNVASVYSGEAWFSDKICSENILVETVKAELKIKKNRLVKIAYGTWRSEILPKECQRFCQRINLSKYVPDIKNLVDNFSMFPEVSFSYQKGNELEEYDVQIVGVVDDKLRCIEIESNKPKLFFISQIITAFQFNIDTVHPVMCRVPCRQLRVDMFSITQKVGCHLHSFE